MSVEDVDHVRASYHHSFKKSVWKASVELQLPKTTVGNVLRKRLHMHPYQLQLLPALKPSGVQ